MKRVPSRIFLVGLAGALCTLPGAPWAAEIRHITPEMTFSLNLRTNEALRVFVYTIADPQAGIRSIPPLDQALKATIPGYSEPAIIPIFWSFGAPTTIAGPMRLEFPKGFHQALAYEIQTNAALRTVAVVTTNTAFIRVESGEWMTYVGALPHAQTTNSTLPAPKVVPRLALLIGELEFPVLNFEPGFKIPGPVLLSLRNRLRQDSGLYTFAISRHVGEPSPGATEVSQSAVSMESSDDLVRWRTLFYELLGQDQGHFFRMNIRR